jgi:phage major head subunit gpT-like protein
MIINTANLRTLQTGFNTAFNQAFAEASSQYQQIAMVAPSTTAKETYGWLGQSTGFSEWLGDRQIQNLQAHDYTIKNKDFENTVKIPRNDIEDDSYGVYTPVIAQLGQDAKVHPDELCFGLLKAGFATACYDGQYFFDTDHPVKGQSVSNSGGGSGTAWYLLDTSRIVKPIIYQPRKPYKFVALTKDDDENVFMRKEFIYGADGRGNVGYGLWQMAYASKQTLDIDSYAAARAAMMSFTGDSGKPLNVKPTLLVVPPALEKAALQILNAEMVGNNTNVYRGTASLLVTPWIV